MKRIVVLDDDPARRIGFRDACEVDAGLTMAESVADGLKKWAPPYDAVFLDHDLGDHVYMSSDHEQTGAEFLRRIGPETLAETPVVIHSYNPAGALNMARMLVGAGCAEVVLQPFGPTALRTARQVLGIEPANI